MDTLAIIGAGEAALPIIQKAQEIGVVTLAFGRLDSYAKGIVDVFIEENSFDIDFMAEKCREYNVTGVMASSEITTEVAARLAAKLQLPGNSIEGGFAGKNKFEMRNRVSHVNSVKQPNYELYNADRTYKFPVVVKAVDSCGKKGVSLVRDVSEFFQAIKKAQENSTDGNALIEEYIEGGQEYSIECLSNEGYHQIIQYTEKESSGPPHFVEIAHHQPATLSEKMKKRIEIAVRDILDVLGLCCGMAHLELKIVGDDIYFIEVGARHGGDHIGDVLTITSTDFDYFKAAIDCALGRYQMIIPHNVACCGIYFHCQQNAYRASLFAKAQKSSWCIENTVKQSDFIEANSNVESSESGYIIYKSDHKITITNC